MDVFGKIVAVVVVTVIGACFAAIVVALTVYVVRAVGG
jgi:hypothetical protein